MKIDIETGKDLIDELLNLYYICEKQCRSIEQSIEELNRKN